MAYRVAVTVNGEKVVGLVPDDVISNTMRLTGGAGHQRAYEWIADRAAGLERAIAAKHRGDRVRAPFDRIVLSEEN